MRSLVVNTETISIAANTPTTGTLGSKIPSYGTKASVPAYVQPLSSAHVRAEYGERADRMRLVFVPVGTTVSEGYGVWLSGESGSAAPWIVVSVQAWKTHTELHIERRDG